MENNNLPRLREIQLQMADALIQFCNFHKLSVWAGYGTLLGAVRHRGFIPWDDDMDFMMLREDFDHLRDLAKTETLPEPLVIDCSRVDVIKIKNCNTTQIAVSKIARDANYGIWIDIWCLDSMPDEDGVSVKEYSRIRRELRIISNAEQMCYSSSKGITSFLFHTYCLVYTGIYGKRHIFANIESAIKRLRGEKLVNFMLSSRAKNNYKYNLLKKYNKEWLSNTVLLPFEDRCFPCPANYHEILSTQYGDYMVPVQSASFHSTTILDVDRPYQVVVNNLLTSLPWYKRFLKMI